MLHPELAWYRDESLWIAISNLVLLLLLVVVFMRQERTGSLLRRATRKLLLKQRANKGLTYALNITVNQYHSLRRRFERRKGAQAPTGPRAPTQVQLEPRPGFVVPPPLDLAPPDGEDPETWGDSALHTGHRPSTVPLRPSETQTQPIPVDRKLLRQTQAPK